MEMYSEYLAETVGGRVVRTASGFASFVPVAEGSMLLKDLYVRPDYRGGVHCSHLHSFMLSVAEEWKCDKIYTSVYMNINKPEASLATALSYGFKLHDVTAQKITLLKEL